MYNKNFKLVSGGYYFREWQPCLVMLQQGILEKAPVHERLIFCFSNFYWAVYFYICILKSY